MITLLYYTVDLFAAFYIMTPLGGVQPLVQPVVPTQQVQPTQQQQVELDKFICTLTTCTDTADSAE